MTANNTHVARVKGIPLTLGGTIHVVPPLALGAMEQLAEALANFTGDIRDTSQISTVVSAAHAALKRNYPDITREQVGEMLDLENMQSVMEAVMDVSGMKRKAHEAANAGEGAGEPTAG